MANIHDKLNKIITSIFGKDVRQALYDGLDTVNKETENTTAKQQHLENTFDQLVINAGTSNAEIVDARVDKNTGKSYSKVGDRMDEVSSLMDNIATLKADKNDVAKISSGTPLFASIVSEMTDITKNYVNTTDGFLYIYSGGEWTKSTIQYQSTGIENKSISPSMLIDYFNENIISDFGLYQWQSGGIYGTGAEYGHGGRIRTTGRIFLKAGTVIKTINPSYQFILVGYTNYEDSTPSFNSGSWVKEYTLPADLYVRIGLYEVNDLVITVNSDVKKYIQILPNNSFEKQIKYNKSNIDSMYLMSNFKTLLDYECTNTVFGDLIGNGKLTLTNNPRRVTSEKINIDKGKTIKTLDENYSFWVYNYDISDKDYSYKKSSGWVKSYYVPNGFDITITIKKDDDANIIPSDDLLNKIVITDSPSEDLTDSYKNEYESLLEKQINLFEKDRISYLMITDIHCEDETQFEGTKRQLEYVVKLANTTDIDVVVVGGDLIKGIKNKKIALSYIRKMMTILGESKKPVITAKGNHDDNAYHWVEPNNRYTTVPFEDVITKKEFTSNCIDRLLNVVHDTENPYSCYYYYDLLNKKTRFIVLDTIDYKLTNNNNPLYADVTAQNQQLIGERQRKWLLDEALTIVDKDWKYFIISHNPLQEPLGVGTVPGVASYGTWVWDMFVALNNKTIYNYGGLNKDFSNFQSKVKIHSFGHTHGDAMVMKTGNIVGISTANSWVDPSNEHWKFINPEHWTSYYNRYVGNFNEALFDVISYSSTLNKVNRLRFGVGNDAELTLS